MPKVKSLLFQDCYQLMSWEPRSLFITNQRIGRRSFIFFFTGSVIDRVAFVIPLWLILRTPGLQMVISCLHVCVCERENASPRPLSPYWQLICWRWKEREMNTDKCVKWTVTGCTNYYIIRKWQHANRITLTNPLDYRGDWLVKICRNSLKNSSRVL